jgi:hypothetical protein
MYTEGGQAEAEKQRLGYRG